MPLTSALIFGSFERTAYGNTYSSGSTSSRQNSSTQSSFFWNCGSVEKSHAICQPAPVRLDVCGSNLQLRLRRDLLGPSVVGFAGGGAYDPVDEDELLGELVPREGLL